MYKMAAVSVHYRYIVFAYYIYLYNTIYIYISYYKCVCVQAR